VDGLFLRGILREIERDVVGSRVGDVRAADEGVLVLRLDRRSDAFCLIATPPLGTVFVAPLADLPPLPAPEREPVFARNLRSSEIVGLRTVGWAPRVDISLERTDAVGLSTERAIIADLGSRPWLAPRTPERETPAPQEPPRIEPDRLRVELLAEWLGGDRTIRRLLRSIGDRVEGGPARVVGDIVALLAARSGGMVDRETELTDELLADIPEALAQVARGEGPIVRPTVLFRRDASKRLHVRLTCVDAAFTGFERRSFDTFNEAARFAFTEFWPTFDVDRRRLDAAKSLDRAIRRKERAVRKVAAEIEDSGRAAEHRRRAELLLARQKDVPRGAARVTLEDFDGSSRVEIELDPRLGPVANAEKLFRAAKKADRRAGRAPERLEQLEKELEDLRAKRRAVDDASADDLARPAGRRPSRGAPGKRRRDQERARFRSYTVSGGWEVLVGKSNRDNDVLTHRIAAQEDLWFHARQAAGSHVVLRRAGRKAEPDPRAIREAAAIAAFHSKAGKSGKTAVCYTEKRYVRKPRGSKPGLAEVKREKVVMVYPALPKDEPR